MIFWESNFEAEFRDLHVPCWWLNVYQSWQQLHVNQHKVSVFGCNIKEEGLCPRAESTKVKKEIIMLQFG